MYPYQNNQIEEYSQPVRLSPPERLNHITSGVVVPLLQALVTGFLIGLAALAVCAWLGWPWLAVSGSVAAVVMAVSWLSFRSRWQWVIERALGVDLNLDGYIGAPPERVPVEPVRVILSSKDGRETDFIDLPAKPEQLRQLADGLSAGRSFSLSAWTGSGAPFSRAEFEALRGELLRRGLARWKNDTSQAQGIELLASGKAILRRFASETVSSSPTLEGREARK